MIQAVPLVQQRVPAVASAVIAIHSSLQRILVPIHVQMDYMATLRTGNAIVRNSQVPAPDILYIESKHVIQAVPLVQHQVPAAARAVMDYIFI